MESGCLSWTEVTVMRGLAFILQNQKVQADVIKY